MSTVLPAPDSGLTEAAEDEAVRSKSGFWALTLGSAGVVYGDIGTSPLYAFRAAIVAAAPGGEVMRGTVIGVLSLIIWALIIIVTMKYVMVLLRADNRGEGGTLALMALARKRLASERGRRSARDCQCRAVLRRCRDYACALRIVGDRGAQGRHAGVQQLHRAFDRVDSGLFVRIRASGNRRDRDLLWSDHRRVVCRHRHRGRSAMSQLIPACWRPSIR